MLSNGGLSLTFEGITTIHRVLYEGVHAWHEGTDRRIVYLLGSRVNTPGSLSDRAKAALREEIERLRILHVTPQRRQAADHEAQLARVAWLGGQVAEAEAAWFKALAELEAATAALSHHPALDQEPLAAGRCASP